MRHEAGAQALSEVKFVVFYPLSAAVGSVLRVQAGDIAGYLN